MGRSYEDKANICLDRIDSGMVWKDVAINLGKALVYAVLSISTGGR